MDRWHDGYHFLYFFSILDIIKGIKLVEFLINRGADINAKDKDDKMPIHDAAINGNREVVEFLMENQLKPSEIDVLIMGFNGDNQFDDFYAELQSDLLY